MQAKGIAKEKLFAGSGVAASKPVDAKAVRIVETALIPCNGDLVLKDFIGNGGWVLAEESGDSPEGFAFVQKLFHNKCGQQGPNVYGFVVLNWT